MPVTMRLRLCHPVLDLSNTKHKKEKLKLRLKLPRERENPGLLFSVVMNAACAFHAPTKYVECSKQPGRPLVGPQKQRPLKVQAGVKQTKGNGNGDL